MILMEIRRVYLTKILSYGLDSILIEENMIMRAIEVINGNDLLALIPDRPIILLAMMIGWTFDNSRNCRISNVERKYFNSRK